MTRKKISFEGLSRLPFEEWDNEEIPEVRPTTRRSPYDRSEIKKEAQVSGNDYADQRIFYFSMGSGSSGNSSYIGTANEGIIIDAGVKVEEIEKMLASHMIPFGRVKGILLTHDHADHVKHVYSLIRKNRNLRVYCTNRVLTGLLRRHSISKRIKDYHIPIFKEIPFNLCGFSITAFEVPHDGTDNMGFSLEYDNRKFVLATDMGEVSSRARHYISEANYLVIESNYDRDMLINGRYPEYLKARIQTSHGHMDNAATASFLEEIYEKHLSHIFLCHLSQDNNTPEKALSAIRGALERKGLKIGEGNNTIEDRKADVQLVALPRFGATRLFVFQRLLEGLNSK